ncbi:hypothetical protein [Halapricum desulfuricans]|nr:hypothetical protein [Halapricum desulfuricans]
MSSSEAYILNEIQNPAALRVVFDSIADGNETKEEIQEDTCLPDGSTEEILGGLVLLRLISRSDFGYEATSLSWDTGDRHRDFQLSALENLAKEATAEDWGKQAAVLLNYEYLISRNIQEFENNERALYEDIDYWIKKETDYRPKGDGEIYKHNDVKFANWTRLVEYLGLVHKVSGRQHTVYPDPELILASIRRATENYPVQGEKADIEVRDYLEWLDSNLLRIGYSTGGTVPEILTQCLFSLVRSRQIRLVEYGDAGSVTFTHLPNRAHSGIDQEANSIKLL